MQQYFFNLSTILDQFFINQQTFDISALSHDLQMHLERLGFQPQTNLLYRKNEPLKYAEIIVPITTNGVAMVQSWNFTLSTPRDEAYQICKFWLAHSESIFTFDSVITKSDLINDLGDEEYYLGNAADKIQLNT